MLTGVIISNLLIALLCLYVAKRLRMLTQALLQFEKRMSLMEHNTHLVLRQAPEFVSRGQMGTAGLRQRYQQLQRQWQQLQQFLTILGLGKTLWNSSRNRSRFRSSVKL